MKLLILLTLLTSQAALARVDVKETTRVEIPTAPSTAWTADDVSKVIPTDMKSSSDAGFIATKIGDRAAQAWLSSASAKDSSLVRTANKVQNSMKSEISVKGQQTNSVEHKFTFQFLAFQAVTQLRYTGWLNAAIDFNARANETKFEITQKMFTNKDFVVSHIANSEQGLSSIGLRWNW
jgi:prophage DNA circulation protein